MTEKLFQYIWQFQYYNKSELTTTAGEKLEVIFAGNPNTNQGPDFLNAQIKIGSTVLAGSIELHLKTSDWFQHGHQHDDNYKNTILHVVFQDDMPEDTSIPVTELRGRISKILLDKYQSLMDVAVFISCAGSIHSVKELTWVSWKDRLLAERLTRKAKEVFRFLEQNNFHWEETLWWLLARNFGIKVNSDAFEEMARTISINTLSKHKNQIHHLEALLMGQAGLLNDNFSEQYPMLLQREYRFLQKKYKLVQIHQPVHFLRMRPGNFPTVRLAQLSMLVHHSVHLFSSIIEINHVEDIIDKLSITANDYWKYHYIFDQPSAFREKNLGKDMIHNLIINTFVPLLFAYGIYHKEEKFKEKAVLWLSQLKGENNVIVKGFSNLNLKTISAFDSQAFIELKTQYCDKRKCLQCAVGNSMLKNN